MNSFDINRFSHILWSMKMQVRLCVKLQPTIVTCTSLTENQNGITNKYYEYTHTQGKKTFISAVAYSSRVR